MSERTPPGSGRPSRPSKTVTFPPTAWDKEENVITGRDAPRRSVAMSTPAPPLTVMDESDARAHLFTLFKAAGFNLQLNYSFRQETVFTTLDAYDPTFRVGFSFISHGDQDVITDMGEAEELAFTELAATGQAHVLILHDHDVPTPAALDERAKAFLLPLRRRR